MRVGVIGLGTMGAPVARNVARAGFDLVVHDIKTEAGQEFIDQGAAWADSPASLIDAVDVVITMVFGPKQIDEVARGPGGLLSGECRERVWIDLTTTRPSLSRELGSLFEERGGYLVDAPVTGSVDAAIRGDMPMFVGGSDAAVERCKTVLDAIGEIRRVGRHGNGAAAKLVNNQLWKIQAAAIGEAMVAAKKAGIAPEIWWESMKGGAADSFVMHHDVPSIFAGHYDPSFPLALVLKDLDLIEEFLQEHGVDAPITRAMHQQFREARDAYGDDAGEMTVCRLIEDRAGVSLRVPGDWQAPWDVDPKAA